MGLGFKVPNGQDVEKAFKATIDHLIDQRNDIGGEALETAGSAAVAIPMNTAGSIASTGRLERAHMLKNPKWTAKRFIRKAGPLGVAASTLLDTHQGRENSEKIFGSNPNMGQRATSIGSSIANGLTLGLFNFNNPEDIKKMYRYYGGK